MQLYLRFRHATAAAVDVSENSYGWSPVARFVVTLWREDMYSRFRFGELLDVNRGLASVTGRPDIIAAAVELANR